jgi:hypothetical protein
MQPWWLAARSPDLTDFPVNQSALSRVFRLLEISVATNAQVAATLAEALATQQKSLLEIQALKSTASTLQEANVLLEEALGAAQAAIATLQEQVANAGPSAEVEALANEVLAEARKADEELPDITG